MPGGPTQAPLFMPARPHCRAGDTVLWQYHRDELIDGVGYDVNELHPPDARASYGVHERPNRPDVDLTPPTASRAGEA